MLWSNLGINYNYRGSGANITSDLTYLYNLGFRKIRIGIPDYTDATSITAWRVAVQLALSLGFTTVIWGLSTTTITSSTKAAFFTALETEAAWAQTQNNAALWFNMGNEEELHVDGSTITASTIQANLVTESATIKGIYTKGNVIYTVGQVGTDYTRWKNSMGSIDLLGVNLYDFNNIFQSSLTQLVSDLGSKAFLSEFGYRDETGTDPAGYCDFNDEGQFLNTMAFRLNAIEGSGIQSGFIYNFMETPNCFGLKLTNGNYRYAFPSLTGQRFWFFGNPNLTIGSQRSTASRSIISRSSLLTRSLF